MNLPTHEMLLGLGGVLAIVLAPIFFILEVAFGGLGVGEVTSVIVAVIFGFLLLVAVGVMRRNLLGGIILAFLASVLLFLGGLGGVIGGVFGLLGSLVAFLKNYKTLLP